MGFNIFRQRHYLASVCGVQQLESIIVLNVNTARERLVIGDALGLA
ncbi:hypothetical protein [Azoarcus sp. DN11]|nr:hypothetical protein [Azoarcus sp. DN11]